MPVADIWHCLAEAVDFMIIKLFQFTIPFTALAKAPYEILPLLSVGKDARNFSLSVSMLFEDRRAMVFATEFGIDVFANQKSSKSS